ncbi:hypothetical protein CkaCkLH20_10661 [Colletotrichum karsti]|uniref:F-box domain-containing protein n=1 Tax=Colletotrichum karsti TaxID=1095194 RepID=A0A9P6LGR9_9PEZI|nr:uncharacterized protein CkaCkLH20_10661 [Colletotrichum karsti]KAF9871727.1 hypothetical protein CkaCkLH20_10661 [Colletotrichum karsti]
MAKLDELPAELMLHIASFFQYKRPSKLRIYQDVDTLPISKNLRNERLHLISLSLSCKFIYNALAEELQELHRFIAIGHRNSTQKLLSLLSLLQKSPHLGEQVTKLYIHLEPVFMGRTVITQGRFSRLLEWGNSKGLDVDPSYLPPNDDEERNDWEYVTDNEEETSGGADDSLNSGDSNDPNSAAPASFTLYELPSDNDMDGVHEHGVFEAVDENSESNEMRYQDDDYLAFMAVLLLAALPNLEEVAISTSAFLFKCFEDHLWSLRGPALEEVETGNSLRDTVQGLPNVRPLSSLKSVSLRYYYPPMGWRKNAAQAEDVATFGQLGLNVTELFVQTFSIQVYGATPLASMTNLTSLILKDVYFHDGRLQDFLYIVPNLTKFMYFEPYENDDDEVTMIVDGKTILDALKRSPAAKQLLTLCLSSDSGFGISACSPETSYDTLEDFVSLQNLWIDTWGVCHAPNGDPEEATAINSVIRTLPSSLRRVHFSGSTMELQSNLSWLSKSCKPHMLPQLEEIAFECNEVAFRIIHDVFQAAGVRASRNIETAPVMW